MQDRMNECKRAGNEDKEKEKEDTLQSLHVPAL